MSLTAARAAAPADVRTIVYGLVDEPTSFGERVELGGCCVSPGSPAFRCGQCRHAWGQESEQNEWTATFITGSGWRENSR